MKTTEQKIKQANRLMVLLVKNKDVNNLPCQRYYKILKVYQRLKEELRDELMQKERNKIQEASENICNCYFDKPELRVTSTTYERYKKRINKEIDIRFKDR